MQELLPSDKEHPIIQEIDRLIAGMAPRIAGVYEKYHGQIKTYEQAFTFAVELLAAITEAPGVPKESKELITDMYYGRSQSLYLVDFFVDKGAIVEVQDKEVFTGKNNFGAVLPLTYDDSTKVQFVAFVDSGFAKKSDRGNYYSPNLFSKLKSHEIGVHGTLHSAAYENLGSLYAKEFRWVSTKWKMRHEALAAMVDFVFVRTIPVEFLQEELNNLFILGGQRKISPTIALRQTEAINHFLGFDIDAVARFDTKAYHKREFVDPNPIYYNAVIKILY